MVGGMRQSGILAAAASYALDHNIERLANDHAHAHQLATGLTQFGLKIEPCYTNMVYFHHAQAPTLIEKLSQQGIQALALTPTRIRMVTHLHITTDDIKKTIQAVGNQLSSTGQLK